MNALPMREKPQVMVDLETMSLEPNAAITAIGAVEFSLTGVTSNTFYCKIDLVSSVGAGGHMDPATVLWWLQQSDEARREIYTPDLSLTSGLSQFARYVEKINPVGIWGNGAAMDNVVLRQAYKSIDMAVPWSYRDDMCYRTEKRISPIRSGAFDGVSHHAKDDAVNQATHLVRIWNGE